MAVPFHREQIYNEPRFKNMSRLWQKQSGVHRDSVLLTGYGQSDGLDSDSSFDKVDTNNVPNEKTLWHIHVEKWQNNIPVKFRKGKETDLLV